MTWPFCMVVGFWTTNFLPTPLSILLVCNSVIDHTRYTCIIYKPFFWHLVYLTYLIFGNKKEEYRVTMCKYSNDLLLNILHHTIQCIILQTWKYFAEVFNPSSLSWFCTSAICVCSAAMLNNIHTFS